MNRFILIAFLLSFVISVKAQNNRITYNGQDLFLNGTNLAWIDFANDIGTENVNFERFGEVFKEIHDYGGNSVRLWLHTTGTATPEFSADTVVGPGVGAVEDLTQILDSAYKYDVGLVLCLWSFDMLRLSIGEPYLTRNRKILEEEAALNSYIEYALKPMVEATKDHPGIIAWEVINEPEGMIPTAHWGGWSDIGHVTRENVQTLINRTAGAIHRIDPDLLVTSGVHNMYSLTEKGDGNFYSDEALAAVGGDADGYLDFYQLHHYDCDLNAFEHGYDYWGFDKPVLIGEFHPGNEDLGEFSNYETLIDSGYAGAMGWMWLDAYGDKIKDEVQYLFLNRTEEVDIDNNLGDTPALYLEGPEDGSTLESGVDVDFIAEAIDTDGLITKVDFILYQEQVSNTVLFSDTEAPYEFTWESPDDGSYGVYALTVDNDGYIKTTNKILFTVGTPPRYRYEAEDAEIVGAEIKTNDEASNGKYVDFYQDGNSLKWTIPNCPEDGSYDMIMAYGVFYGEKNNFIVINETDSIDQHFAGTDEGWLKDTITVDLQEGLNTITILPSWGWMQFDYIEFPFARLPQATAISLTTESGDDFINTNGGTLQMVANIVPEEAGFYPVEWSASPKWVAEIDESGLVTAKKQGTLVVTGTTTDGSDLSAEFEIAITNQTGIDESSAAGVKLYPNPVTDMLYIETENNVDLATVEIYNTQGALIDVFTNSDNLNAINVSAYQQGVYYISVKTINNEHKISMFVKQK